MGQCSGKYGAVPHQAAAHLVIENRAVHDSPPPRPDTPAVRVNRHQENQRHNYDRDRAMRHLDLQPAVPDQIRIPDVNILPPQVEAASPRGAEAAFAEEIQHVDAPVQAPVAVAAGNAQEAVQPAAEVRRLDRIRLAQQRVEGFLRLTHLRLHDNEPNHELVFAPPVPVGAFEPVAPAVDAVAAGFEGRAYLEFLRTDPRSPPSLVVLIDDKLLDATKKLSELRIINIADRLRSVLAETYIDPHLSGEIEIIAREGLPHCLDRADVAVGQMEAAAIHARLMRGDENEDSTLYNYGVSYFMLNAVREETEKLLSERRAAGIEAPQEVHDLQNAIYYLQDELHLPHRLQEPIIPDARYVIVTPDVAREEIGARVRDRAFRNNG